MFSITTCADQEFSARMTYHSCKLLSWVSPEERGAFNEADQLLARNLHGAMGYRREHNNPLEF